LYAQLGPNAPNAFSDCRLKSTLKLDLTEPPSESFDRQEVIVLVGENA
jgi:hypothetical protein